MNSDDELPPHPYPLPGSTPWYNKRAREESEKAIGRICMAFQQLEELVSCLIGRLTSDDNQLGTIITAELSFRNKVALLCSLYLYRAAVPEPPEAFKMLLARLRRAEERRNTMLHSYWVKSPVCGMLIRFKYTAKSAKGFAHHVEDIEPANIEAIAKETELVAEDLPPGDLRSAAEAKRRSGSLNRSRVFLECVKLNGLLGLFLAFRFARFLRHAEFGGPLSLVGLSRRRLGRLDRIWAERLLRRKERPQNNVSARTKGTEEIGL